MDAYTLSAALVAAWRVSLRLMKAAVTRAASAWWRNEHGG